MRERWSLWLPEATIALVLAVHGIGDAQTGRWWSAATVWLLAGAVLVLAARNLAPDRRPGSPTPD